MRFCAAFAVMLYHCTYKPFLSSSVTRSLAETCDGSATPADLTRTVETALEGIGLPHNAEEISDSAPLGSTTGTRILHVSPTHNAAEPAHVALKQQERSVVITGSLRLRSRNRDSYTRW